jgi:glycosyltransferase involved in cell wall biosynthesis
LHPLVSICIPTYNGGRFIDAALASAAAQDYPNVEVVVVDDASRDETLERLHSWRGGHLRLVVHRTNRGHNATWSETVERARGKYLKFLHQDDELRPDCVSRMVGALEKSPGAGLAFSRRKLRFEGVPAEGQAEWIRRNGRLEAEFRRLKPVNRGMDLFREWFESGFGANWIGEPSVVMVRRNCLERVGGFATHIRQATDVDLWMRIAARFDVCYIDDELATFTVGATSLSVRNRMSRATWLDRLWLLEGLGYDAELLRALPEISQLLAAERRQAFRSAARLGRLKDGSHVPAPLYIKYLRFRAMSLLRTEHPPFQRL